MLSWEHGMTIDSWSDDDHDLARLLREWIVAYEQWMQLDADKAPTSPGLADERWA